MTHCCPIDKTLLTTQYKTKPDGKNKNITENNKGINNIILACTGSAGAGLNLVVMYIEMAYKTGKINHGSGLDKSVIQPIQGAPRISTEACNTQYKDKKIGI